jgi:hypothetical protein
MSSSTIRLILFSERYEYEISPLLTITISPLHMDGRSAAGVTTREEPAIIRRSALDTIFRHSYSYFTFSPKKTISGLITPPHSSHLGTSSLMVFSKEL